MLSVLDVDVVLQKFQTDKMSMSLNHCLDAACAFCCQQTVSSKMVIFW